MGEMADMACASSDPFDEFERAGSGEYSRNQQGSQARSKQQMEWRNNRLKYDSQWQRNTAILNSKTKTTVTICEKEFDVSEKAQKYIMYLKPGSRVNYTLFKKEVVYIRMVEE